MNADNKTTKPESLIKFRPYQQEVFNDRETGLQVLFWSRQIGKSFTLAAFAVDRLLTRPGRLVTVLSNSRENGAELNMKCREVCQMLELAHEQEDLSPDIRYENMNMETRIEVEGKVGRIKVLAANPRTARGFSGDLILDEFAFHEDSFGIWAAAEPILSSNPDFLCRVSSTPNGTHNMFYQLVTNGQFKISKVRRTDAHEQGLKIYDLATRGKITPAQARERAVDKRSYDQNYELEWADENTTLLTYALIGAAEREGIGVICEQEWTAEAEEFMRHARGDLYVGIDVGRRKDLTVITVLEQMGAQFLARAILRIRNMRLPQQKVLLGVPCRMPKFRQACIDMTGLGLGLCEFAQDEFGLYRIQGIDFGTTVPMTDKIAATGRRQPTVRVTEAMATELVQVYEDHAIKHPCDRELRDSLRKPEKAVTPGGRVSIAVERTEAGHADEFWSIALAIEAAGTGGVPFAYQSLGVARGQSGSAGSGIRNQRAVLI